MLHTNGQSSPAHLVKASELIPRGTEGSVPGNPFGRSHGAKSVGPFGLTMVFKGSLGVGNRRGLVGSPPRRPMTAAPRDGADGTLWGGGEAAKDRCVGMD